MHPLNVESVAWISQRKGLLALVFFLLSILWYVKEEDRRDADVRAGPAGFRAGKYYWLSFLAFLLALLSKGSVVILPVILLGIIVWRRPLRRWDLARMTPFLVAAIALAVVNVWYQNRLQETPFRTANFLERSVGAGAVVWFYLSKAVAPIDLAFVYPQWHIQTDKLLWWLPLLAAFAVTAVLWRQRSNPWSRPLLLAWGFFCAALVPVLGFADVGFMQYSLVADHYPYIALIGVVTLVAAGFSDWHERTQAAHPSAATATAIIIVGMLMVLTHQQCQLYGSPVALYQETLKKNPDCWMAHNNLGYALAKKDQLPEAIEHYQEALRLNPDYYAANNNLGAALFQANRVAEAIEQYEQVLRLKPDFADAHYNLGNALVSLGRTEEAIQQYQQVLRLKPDSAAEVHCAMGVVLLGAGRPQEAIDHLEQSLQLNLDYPKARFQLANALMQAGRLTDAVQQYQQALRLMPESAKIHNSLGTALLATGRPAEAMEHFQQALNINPKYVEACNNLAWVLANSSVDRLRNPSQAVELAKKAVELDPQRTDLLNTLGAAEYRAGHWQEAIGWLDKSTQADAGGSASDWFFLAMAHQRLGHHEEARNDYDKAVQWMDQHAPHDEELLRFRQEAQELLARKPATGADAEHVPAK